ncbi:MAG: anthranilate synthase component I family protein [Nitritalea sp.]
MNKNTLPIHRIPVKENDLPLFLRLLSAHFPYVALFDPRGQADFPLGPFRFGLFAGTQPLDLEEVAAQAEHLGLPIPFCVGYDYKNRLEKLTSENAVLVDTPETFAFLPDLALFREGEEYVLQGTAAALWQHRFVQVRQVRRGERVVLGRGPLQVEALTSEEAYAERVAAIHQLIRAGMVYEMNFCMAYQVKGQLDPVDFYLRLAAQNPMPFGGFLQVGDRFLACASPERFLKLQGGEIWAQPMKGTISRGKGPEEDTALRLQLAASEKERAENLMIVDLMRNDLAKLATLGSVEVVERFGVYPFPRVNQMISTVKAKLAGPIGLQELLAAAFPMGSMTGAPKIRTMEAIEELENFRRGWFSGTFGYWKPGGEVDMNVLIRSFFYDRAAEKGFFAVGSAITIDAKAGEEYAECQLKASGIRRVLAGE